MGWLGGFHRNITAATSSLMAEGWALRDGLVLAKNDNIRKLEIEIDSLGVIQLLNDHDTANHPLGHMSLMEAFEVVCRAYLS